MTSLSLLFHLILSPNILASFHLFLPPSKMYRVRANERHSMGLSYIQLAVYRRERKTDSQIDWLKNILDFLAFKNKTIDEISISNLLPFQLHLMSFCCFLLIHHGAHYHLIYAKSEKQKVVGSNTKKSNIQWQSETNDFWKGFKQYSIPNLLRIVSGTLMRN